MTVLADLYDADQRHRDPVVADLAARLSIPHPLHQVEYADGAERCTHAKTCQPLHMTPESA